MKIICPSNDAVKRLIKPCDYHKDVHFSKYCLRIPCKEGELFYNNLSHELILLDEEEKNNYLNNQKLKEELIDHLFLVNEDDETKRVKEFKNIISLFNRKKELNKFVIFPTTDCNARCFYCYELTRKRIHMNEEVAKDVANYIIKKNNSNKISIQWFGGEPLYNYKAIDIISDILNEKRINFNSTMVSNGYLFDEELIDKAVNKWHLEYVQITIDGTEELYNATKAYIYKDPSPFKKIINNMHLLLEKGIRVEARLNMDNRNVDDLNILSDQLLSEFGKYNNFTIYTRLLKDFGHKIHEFNSIKEALDNYEKLQNKLLASGHGQIHYVQKEYQYNQCMADDDGSITILPDGRIGKCEHESEENLIGSIYDESFDEEMIKSWKDSIFIEDCNNCFLYPNCILLKKCAWNIDGCDMYRQEALINIKNKILAEYNRYKKDSILKEL